MSSPSAVLVVGAGLGGLGTVEQLRRSGYTGRLTLVGEEPDWPYDRPPLSKAALQAGTPAPLLRAVKDYPELDLDLRLGRSAVALDTEACTVRLDDDTVLDYDALVLAPGAAPRRLPGPALAGVHVLRTQDDAAALRADVVRHGALAIVGGGFIGCEVAASARRLGAEVDLVELLAGPLVRVVGPAVAGRVAQLHLDHGVRLHGGVGVRALHGDDGEGGKGDGDGGGGGSVVAVELGDGQVLPTRVVLVGLGVVPATGWLGDSLTLAADLGICCDETGLAAPGVWAVGDAAVWGTARRVEHWTSAVEQAAAVAQSVLGRPTADTSVPYVWSDQYDSTLQCVGEVGPDTEREVLEVGAGLAALHLDGDRFVGAALLDLRKQAGRVRRVLAADGSAADARAALLR